MKVLRSSLLRVHVLKACFNGLIVIAGGLTVIWEGEELEDESIGIARHDPVDADKPLLAIAQQIEHLKSKGVAFELCSEQEAADYLSNHSYFFKIMAYRTLFERHVGGLRDGQYVGLDFGHLRMLASVDRLLRYTLLPMTLDVEHFARTKLMRELATHGSEDGYAIVRDYVACLNHDNRRRRVGEMRALEADLYTGDLVRKYFVNGTFDHMPVWVFLELVSFGTFIDFYLFCAKRWGNRSMVHEHYRLRQVKSCRNAAAHSSNVINGFVGGGAATKMDSEVGAAIARAGISRRVRAARMSNQRLQQIATLLYIHSKIVPEGMSRTRSRAELMQLKIELGKVKGALPRNDAVNSSFGFLITLIDSWYQ